MRELRTKFGTAILFISHNLGTVARLCDRLGVLYAGQRRPYPAVAGKPKMTPANLEAEFET